ncbi:MULTISPECIES: hypothetical protein [unclassified Phyllobacterium]|uniref:hypothetical protein n=1 Tax=unclassified Phyllobacterium TaxID=2638441 RepID=UPI003013052F
MLENTWLRPRSRGFVYIAAVIVIGVFAGAALTHLVLIKPADISWARWTEHAFNRYQTFIAGVGAIGIAWLSVEKIREQISLQRDQAVSDKRFAMRKELSALTECIRLSVFVQKLTAQDISSIGIYSNQNRPFIDANPMQILEFHRASLPMDICVHLERMAKLIQSHNNFHNAPAAQQELFGTPEFMFRGVQAQAKALQEKALTAADELDSYLK